MNKGKIIGNLSAFLGGIILAGIVAGFADEKLGYSAFTTYAFALFGHSRVSDLIEKKVNKE